MLIAAASIGTSNESGLTTEQETAADVNGGSEINAVDAAIILQYAATVGSGENVTIKEFV